MSYTRVNPLRPLEAQERETLERVSRSESERVDRARRAKALLGVADGKFYADAAREAGYKVDGSVSRLVSEFNKRGLGVLDRKPGGHPPVVYGESEKARILMEVQRTPDIKTDGAASWSIALLQKSLRSAEDGLPNVSTYTIHQTLKDAGYSWQRTRTWCNTGSVKRKRKGGTVTVTDPECEEKRGN